MRRPNSALSVHSNVTCARAEASNGNGERTEPGTDETIRSGKQSLVAWARGGDPRRAMNRQTRMTANDRPTRRRVTAGAKRSMATPLEAERPRDGSPGGNTENP